TGSTASGAGAGEFLDAFAHVVSECGIDDAKLGAVLDEPLVLGTRLGHSASRARMLLETRLVSDAAALLSRISGGGGHPRSRPAFALRAAFGVFGGEGNPLAIQRVGDYADRAAVGVVAIDTAHDLRFCRVDLDGESAFDLSRPVTVRLPPG